MQIVIDPAGHNESSDSHYDELKNYFFCNQQDLYGLLTQQINDYRANINFIELSELTAY
ncbi:hypothetical protein [Parashewanella spongiae]|uniref:hypothetical protein n=1 Tax=Parashewanella spongiae TaxID=342950 RepID=UPI0014774E00|nr:hypothetical protein [Parashewanella spongiae]